MSARTEPWQIAADIEKLAIAIGSASLMLSDFDRAVLDEMFKAAPELSAIDDTAMFNALMALSSKYQAIAETEPDGREADALRTGFREEDFA